MITCTMRGYVFAATKSGRNETVRYLTVTRDWATLPWPRLPVKGEMISLAGGKIEFVVSSVGFCSNGDVHLILDFRFGERIYSISDVRDFEAHGCEIEIGSPADPMGMERFRKSSDQD